MNIIEIYLYLQENGLKASHCDQYTTPLSTLVTPPYGDYDTDCITLHLYMGKLNIFRGK